MKQINRFINQKKDRILYGVKIYLGMVIAGMLVLFMIARGNIDLILDKMLPETITILTSFLTIAASLIAMQIRMRLSFNRFSREEQSRINREAAKMPELHDFLITSDVLVFVIGLRSYLIRIDDILWAFGTEASKFHSSYSNGFSALIPRKQYEFILLLKDGTSISIPLRAEADNSRAEIAYAINVIQRKRPGVFTHFIVDHQTFWKKQFARIRETVEAAGTTDGAELEMQYNLEHWYQEPIPNYDPVQNEAIHGAIHSQTEGWLFLFLLFAIVLAGFLYYNIPDLIPVSTGFSGILETRILRLFLPGAIMTCIPLLTLFVWIKKVICNRARKKYPALQILYICLLLSSVMFLTSFILLANKNTKGFSAALDYSIYHDKKWETYQGPIIWTNTPVDLDRRVRIITQADVYYLQSELDYYRIDKSCYHGNPLPPGEYIVSYLPNTKLVCSLKDADGNELLFP